MPRLRFPDHALVQRMVEHCVKSGNPLMLAHDDGVYLCADGLRDSGGRLECAYAAGCDPRTDADAFETARGLVGGDDFGMPFNLGDGAVLLAALRRGDHLVIGFNARFVSLFTERVMPHPPTTPPARGRGAESTTNARTRNDEMTTKTKATKSTNTKAAPKSGERLKKAAQAEIAERLEALDGGKQDHEVPTAKEIANNANVEAAVKAAKESPTAANGAPGGKKATAGAKAAKRAPAATKAAKDAKGPKAAKPKRVSALDAAAIVLGESKDPMNTTDLIKTMAEHKLWTSPNGATPEQTLYAAIVREINAKGKDARFVKVERGHFALAPHARKKA